MSEQRENKKSATKSKGGFMSKSHETEASSPVAEKSPILRISVPSWEESWLLSSHGDEDA
jgi:hypothetical protein